MVTIGKPINGITINGLEWLLSETGDIKQFQTREDAKEFLKGNGFKEFSDEELEDSFVFEEEESEKL